jgi:hypothetical protein
MKQCPLRLIAATLAVFAGGVAQADTCKRPLRVDSLGQIDRSTLALTNVYGPAAVEDQCTIIDRSVFGSSINFYILPQSLANADTVYVFVKSYRKLTTEPLDQIKVSRGGTWYFPNGSNGSTIPLGRRDDVPFIGTVEDWNKVHSAAGSPEDMEKQLGLRWHAYSDPEEKSWSSQRAGFWSTHADFDFSRGTLTNILIRFPSGGKTPAPFQIGIPKGTTEFQLELNSNADGLSGTYRFVVQ